MNVEQETIGHMPDGQEVRQFTLTNDAGLSASVMTYGATLTAMRVPDRNGSLANVTLWLNGLDDYLAGHPLLGSIAGRCAGRIAGGRFTLDGVPYQLATNVGPNHLHGGNKGFDKVNWRALPAYGYESVGVQLTHTSPDGDEGYPGKLDATVTYRLTADNTLRIEYLAETDKPTYVNLTNHAYWNLAGAGSGDVLGHVLTLNAESYLPLGEGLIPTGEIRPVAGTPMDFTAPTAVSSRIDEVGVGYDACYVLNKNGSAECSLAAKVVDPTSGRVMEVHTTQPGVQFYTANYLDGSLKGDGPAYGKHHALCLEAQHFPDAPNHPNFPSTLLRPGETYEHITVHRFGTTEA